MGQDKKTPITINEVEYLFEDLTKEQQALIESLTTRLTVLEGAK